MKLQRFQQFINENYETLETEEPIFLMDGIIYMPYEYEFDLDWEYEAPDPSVGFYGGAGVDNYELIGVSNVYKITDPEKIEEIKTLISDHSELQTMGFSQSDLSSTLYNILGDADQIEVTGEELKEFEKKFIGLFDSNRIKEIDLLGNFDKIVENFINNVEPPEPDEPDYSDYDDRW